MQTYAKTPPVVYELISAYDVAPIVTVATADGAGPE